MKKLIYLISPLLVVLLQACSSLPDGAQIPNAKIDKITLAEGEKAGFNIDLTLYHRSLEPLPLEKIFVKVELNSKIAADYVEIYKDKLIENNKSVNLSIFVPANKEYQVGKESLLLNKLLKLNTKASINVITTDSDKHQSFNPKAEFEGIISHAN